MEHASPCTFYNETTIKDKSCEPVYDDNENWHRTSLTSVSAWHKIREFIGQPCVRDFRLQTLPMLQPGKGEIVIEALCWSVENFMRDFHVDLGTIMIGELVGCVISSRHQDFPRWMLVVCPSGWRTHALVNPDVVPVRPVGDIGDHPASVCLGVLGLPGLMAYFGLLEICQPQAGNIVLVNAAAGPVGSVVGQLAKLKGCTVIAFAASKDRCDWIRELGFDYVYCTSVAVSAALARQAPKGVDFYFDCVGAEFTKGVVQHMKPTGVICMCGYNSCYGRRVGVDRRTDPYRLIYSRDSNVTSLSLSDFRPKFAEAQAHLLEWLNQGKLRFRETLFNGFQQLPTALTALHNNSSVGNVIVKSSKIDTLTTSLVAL